MNTMNKLTSVDEQAFEQAVLAADAPVLVDFWAPWCGPCYQLEPALAELAAERSDRLSVVKLNSDENPVVSAQYRVMALPTLMLFDRGEPVWSVVGSRPKARLAKELDQALAAIPARPAS